MSYRIIKRTQSEGVTTWIPQKSYGWLIRKWYGLGWAFADFDSAKSFVDKMINPPQPPPSVDEVVWQE